MILDASALVAILRREEGFATYADALARTVDRGERLAVGAATLFELTLVIDRLKDPELSTDTDAFLDVLGLTVVAVTEETARLARAANLRFGKGFHPARLNFGDCLVYALAKQTGEPLLFKGSDFALTDVIPAA